MFCIAKSVQKRIASFEMMSQRQLKTSLAGLGIDEINYFSNRSPDLFPLWSLRMVCWYKIANYYLTHTPIFKLASKCFEMTLLSPALCKQLIYLSQSQDTLYSGWDKKPETGLQFLGAVFGLNAFFIKDNFDQDQ